MTFIFNILFLALIAFQNKYKINIQSLVFFQIIIYELNLKKNKKMSLKVFPNVLVRDHEHKKVLLCMKKRGFGADKWSFCGLHPVGENEGLAESAIRQTKEETGLTVTDLKHVGYIETQVGHDVLAGNLYLANKFKGQIKENDGKSITTNIVNWIAN